MPITFQVDQVEKETVPLPGGKSVKAIMQSRLKGLTPEAFSQPTAEGRIPVSSGAWNSFVGAVHMAYDRHYPLVLTPDIIWLCIVQGFAKHIKANAERLRHLFVEHESKKEISIRRDDFVLGSPSNPWPEVFEEFSQQIRRHIGAKTHDLLTPEFSTTGVVEKAASQVVLMDCFSEYFDYRFFTRCGIPEVTLEGTVDDWAKVRERAFGLAQYDFEWWITALSPVLDQFVDAASGKVDQRFWSSIYKRSNESGGPYINGWIVTLFPYTYHGHRNHLLESWDQCYDRPFGGMKTDAFPPGIVSTPFKWEYLDEEVSMRFYAGFMLYTQNENSLALRPEIGWAVASEAVVQSTNYKKYARRRAQ